MVGGDKFGQPALRRIHFGALFFSLWAFCLRIESLGSVYLIISSSQTSHRGCFCSGFLMVVGYNIFPFHDDSWVLVW